MALDLSALDQEYGDVSGDIYRTLDISLVIEDPDQPRTEFNPEALKELAEDIKARGLMQPILVRAVNGDGQYKIIVGARRYRAHLLAGLTEIDVLVRADETLDDYAQVAENKQREGLTPLELAQFIQKKLNQGEKKSEIAAKLGVDKSSITQLSALIDPPQFFLDLYNSGRCTNPLYFYELKKMHNQWPDEVESWAATAEDITRATIQALYKRLHGPEKEELKVTVTEATGLSGKSGLDSAEGSGSDRDVTGGAGETADEKQPEASPSSKSDIKADEKREPIADGVTVIPPHNPEIEKTEEDAVSDPNKIKKPLLLVEYEGRAAMLLLNRRPSTAGLVHIRYEDGGSNEEVDAGKLKINLLTEASK